MVIYYRIKIINIVLEILYIICTTLNKFQHFYIIKIFEILNHKQLILYFLVHIKELQY